MGLPPPLEIKGSRMLKNISPPIAALAAPRPKLTGTVRLVSRTIPARPHDADADIAGRTQKRTLKADKLLEQIPMILVRARSVRREMERILALLVTRRMTGKKH
jgi:hypothetical protein